MLDYARLNRTILGNESIICLPQSLRLVENAILKKWQESFQVVFYPSLNELGRTLRKEGVEIIYLTKPGPYDRILVPGLKNCVHAQFLCDEFHGDTYVYLSAWMSRVMTGREDSFVPFYVPRLEAKNDLRGKLGIPQKARVFGRHGGWDTFNVPFARKAVLDHAVRNSEDHFVFLNTAPIRGTEKMSNVHYLSATVDPFEKGAFLATCDAMIHARDTGETFGLAVAEFAVLGKPVITYGGSRERAHLEMLGEEGLVYWDRKGLAQILSEFAKGRRGGGKYQTFSDGRVVMEHFQKKFLES